MKINWIIISLIFYFIGSNGYSIDRDDIKTLDWNGLPVTWLKDTRFPLYNITIYFADGSLSDSKRSKGETNAMFGTLDAGTRRYSRKNIQGNLEFFGAALGFNVTHEYTTLGVSGLVKDIAPTVKMMCHLFSDATFPKKELKKEITKGKNSLLNLVSSHGSLANRAFRELSLKGTPYDYPVGGKLKDIVRLNQKGLSKKLDYFNNKVLKRVYISGPSEALSIQTILNNECGWKNQKDLFVRSGAKSIKKNRRPKIILVPVPGANQAQIRIGRYLKKGEFENEELLSLGSGFLGGGFTSKLMREVRVKRGLTYGISSFAAGQKDYGRAGIFTSTRTEKLKQLLDTVKMTIEDITAGNFKPEELERARGLLYGSYPFKFERKDAFLSQLIYLDHIGKDYGELYKFQERIKRITKKEVMEVVKSLFDWSKQTILIVGPKSLKKVLSEYGKVEIVPYKKVL